MAHSGWTEQRRSPRAPVTLTLSLERKVGRPVSVRTLELSVGGARVRASRPLRVDEELHFDVDLPPHLEGTARVLRQDRLDVYALRFEGLEPGSQEELRAFIEATAGARMH